MLHAFHRVKTVFYANIITNADERHLLPKIGAENPYQKTGTINRHDYCPIRCRKPVLEKLHVRRARNRGTGCWYQFLVHARRRISQTHASQRLRPVADPLIWRHHMRHTVVQNSSGRQVVRCRRTAALEQAACFTAVV